mgnify:CR=1 FL=1
MIMMGWITAFNNATVHIIMYYYFAMSELGYKFWWRVYLTRLQIVQFFGERKPGQPELPEWRHLLASLCPQALAA